MDKKAALIADIHGNFSALKAVLDDLDQDKEVEHIYCLGDLIGIGYETNEVLELVSSRKDISFIMGNHDEAIVDIIHGREPYSRGSEREHHEWIAGRLDYQYIPFLEKLPVTIQITINGTNLLCIHYHLDQQGNYLKTDYEPTEKKLDKHYQQSEANIVCFGHHHVVHFFKTKDRLYLNPGSLGCFHKPLASYAVLSIGDFGELKVNLKEVSYDNKHFLLGYKKLQVPDSDYILKVFHGNQHLKW
jgi:putative phosphoesterase